MVKAKFTYTIKYECEVDSTMYPEKINTLVEMYEHEKNNFDYKQLMKAAGNDELKIDISAEDLNEETF
jgi:hypothetical protein